MRRDSMNHFNQEVVTAENKRTAAHLERTGIVRQGQCAEGVTAFIGDAPDSTSDGVDDAGVSM